MERIHTRDEAMEKRLDKYLKDVKYGLTDTDAEDYKHRSKHELKELLGYLREAARIEYKSLERDQDEEWPLHDSRWLASYLDDVFFSPGWLSTQVYCFDKMVQIAQGSSEKISDYGTRFSDIANWLEKPFLPILVVAWISGLSDHRIAATMKSFPKIAKSGFSDTIDCANFLHKVFKIQGHIANATQILENLPSMNSYQGFVYPARVEELLQHLDNDLANCNTRFKAFEDQSTVRGSTNTSGPVILRQQTGSRWGD